MSDIPLLTDYMLYLTNQTLFGQFCVANLIIAGIMMIYFAFFSMPYGKNYTRGRAYLKVEVKDRIAFLLANIPGPIIYILLTVSWPRGEIFQIPSLLYIGFYIHRAIIYPFFRRPQSKPWPLESLIYFSVSNFIEGSILARIHVFETKPYPIIVQILFAIVFIALAVVTAYYDYQICQLRTHGDSGYRIPQGTLFKYISGPNYLFELLTWTFYMLFVSFNLEGVSFGLWLLVNITGRAEASHSWYNSFFKTKYPQDRTAYIPFVKNSRWFL
ncbi:3-oxo-5-alpha-steroid 4-dehydrogenase family protein [Trichomonas vaginalis G3]|uniref:3-oxo-5-alpha-steroid 4-dehydrogenase family protein n=1 Tax=Trichomonas vaginalis (strain ATCC PRA-98 / G3) TaxID=412133 RepID=A2FBB4_TRIV3|nr:3-oxo-5-alpha-steroid 4-dehydrogenase protein [Trichomonas vaginalis G3]EAX97794.1 3-oxo-5-alpha-steroid 4-dehydrogenase family protein [Trichomonas vaginalis G3]KAI5552730.1 3-oxo-5-alpha-steroid 4-dehydrogenase protein [Trichomonas vaginalis G3]|eukprot:XP_001310724.1 3-oxo-5-alpha-steroid 4-dehydrogenase family protein [Trichomonas vaginalis G3]